MNDITKGLKQKRDAEERYRAGRNKGQFIEGVSGDLTYVDPSEYTETMVAGEGIEITSANGAKTITSKQNALTIVNIPVMIDTLVGKDGYILAYNESLNTFYLKKAEVGLDMYSFALVNGDLILRYPDGTTPPEYSVVEDELVLTFPDGSTPPDVRVSDGGDLILNM